MKVIQQIRAGLAAKFIEREPQIDAMLVALLARQNVFMIGPPGTGKSALTRALTETIEGGNYFELLMTKFTTDQEVFGPTKVTELMNDRLVRKTAGYLPEAHIVFLDEFYKANSAILNSLLTAMEEKIRTEEGQKLSLPLLSLFAASNETPQGELAASFDRFGIKLVTGRIKGDASALFKQSGAAALPKISLAELHALQEQVVTVARALSDDVLENLLAIRAEVEKEGIYVSDRRWKAIPLLSAAHALLYGRKKISQEDLEVISDSVWSREADRRTIQKIVTKYSNPDGEKVAGIADAIAEMQGQIDGLNHAQSIDLSQKLKKHISELKSLQKKSETKKISETLAEAEKLHHHILKTKLGLI